MRLLVAILLCTTAALAIFEDQAGKFDWRKQLIGCPNNVIFNRKESKFSRIIVSTEQSVLASLSSQTGEIEWRRVMETPESNLNYVVSTTDGSHVYTISEDGRVVRVWWRQDGSLVRQIPINDKKAKNCAIGVHNGVIFVSSGNKIMRISQEDSNTPSSSITASVNVEFSSFLQSENSQSFAWLLKESDVLNILPIDDNGMFGTPKELRFAVSDPRRCYAQMHYVLCIEDRSLTVADTLTMNVFKSSFDYSIKSISQSASRIIVSGDSKFEIIAVDKGTIKVVKSVDISPLEVIGTSKSSDVLALVSSSSIRIISSDSEKNSDFTFSRELNAANSSPRSVFLNAVKSGAKDFELVIVGHDCRVEMVTVDIADEKVNIDWIKEESLINAVSVEMVDLPLSESQQMIEDEFEESYDNVVSAFLRRIQVQFGQFCRIISKTIERAFFIISAFSKNSNGLSDFISSVRSVSNAGSANSFERDYFNLRKVILITTINGVVFGIDSNDGSVLWKIWLGDDFAPLKSVSQKQRVPLFVQRTTAHYQLDGLATVAFENKKTSNGVVFSFNPMSGTIVARHELDHPIKRISMLPVVNQKHISPVLSIDNKNRVRIFPDVTKEELSLCPSLHLLDFDPTTKGVNGLSVDLVNRKSSTVWSGNIGLGPNDEIVAVKGKSYNQKVHSQGRVLVTREVQYKYVNPNLAAIAYINKNSQQLSIVLVDIVTGQVIHSSSIGKATEPIHMVHSENWIAYSYWSEKGRRTELGILELYEGTDQQSQKDIFDSKLLNKQAPTVVMQSYIYAQGVDAMAVSETEQGLTTRSILIAHPSGHIHEVSKRLLDATRPLELTQAMREEMIIGYMPEIAVATEEMLNYNQTVHRVRGIKTSPSGLESTSLVLAYGTDIFFTRLVPSGTFDILKDDFDHVLISIVLSGLIIGSYVTKRLARSNALSSQWA